jgi:predicted RNase H-like nuclease
MVLGADACRAGWVGLLLTSSSRGRVCVAPTFADLVADAATRGPLELVAVDMPVGLPDSSRRQADVLARAELGPRRSSVFMTPTRAALEQDTHARASAMNKDLAGDGISTQAYHLRPKLKEVETVAFGRTHRVVEVHQEVSFAQLAGHPLPSSKKTPDGMRRRRSLLRAAGIVLTRPDRVGPGVAVDDVLDAAVAAWSGRRVVTGDARSLPDPPELFADGWPGRSGCKGRQPRALTAALIASAVARIRKSAERATTSVFRREATRATAAEVAPRTDNNRARPHRLAASPSRAAWSAARCWTSSAARQSSGPAVRTRRVTSSNPSSAVGCRPICAATVDHRAAAAAGTEQTSPPPPGRVLPSRAGC